MTDDGIDRWDDDGGAQAEVTIVRRRTIVVQRLDHAAEKAAGFHRSHKNMIHFTVILMITVSLWLEGPKIADLGFLALSILCELN